MLTIEEVVVADKNLTTMLRGIKASGLETELNKTGPYTLLAPSEMAFGKLLSGVLPELLKTENKVKLVDLISNHIVMGKTNFKDLKDEQLLKTISGKKLSVKISHGAVIINGAKVQGRDADASNGVVHSIDTVISAN